VDFWIRLDGLIASNEIVIDRPKGSAHPRYPELVYPLDYGYVAGTSAGDGNEIDVWQGLMADKRLVAIVCTVDLVKKDTELKLIIGCNDDEIEIIKGFHNNDYMSGLVVKRSFENES